MLNSEDMPIMVFDSLKKSAVKYCKQEEHREGELHHVISAFISHR